MKGDSGEECNRTVCKKFIKTTLNKILGGENT